MDFEIKRIITNEFNGENINLILNDIENTIIQSLAGQDFGPSVVKYFWGFELFKFDGAYAQHFSDDIDSWKYSRNWLVTNAHFDWNEIKELNNEELIQEFFKGLLAAIGRIETMKKKPKDFNNQAFKAAIENIGINYNRK